MALFIFIVMLCVLIVGHEFGHLVVAKLSRMKVLEFGIGFPPRLFKKRIGETDYSVNAIPFGGFVKIYGEDAEDAGENHAFTSRPKLAQAATIAAGPLMNLVLAVFLTSFALMAGVPASIESPDAPGVTDPRVIALEIVPGAPAERAGLKAGDRLVSVAVNGVEVPVSTPEQFSRVVESATGPLTLSYLRAGVPQVIEATPEAGIVAAEPSRRALGIGLSLIGTKSFPPLEAFAEGFRQTGKEIVFVTKGIAGFIASAFAFKADFSSVAGPVGIVSTVGDAAGFGLGALFSLAALISINLGIVNLIPFPALDGGRIAMIAAEALVGRRIPRAVTGALNYAGFGLLILLMLAVTAHDVARLF